MDTRSSVTTVATDAILRDVALRLCREIREENRGRWYRWTAWMCLGCTAFSKVDPEKMCVSSQPDYRGCIQVNARHDRQQEAKKR
jgi:hypothetical protein